MIRGRLLYYSVTSVESIFLDSYPRSLNYFEKGKQSHPTRFKSTMRMAYPFVSKYTLWWGQSLLEERKLNKCIFIGLNILLIIFKNWLFLDEVTLRKKTVDRRCTYSNSTVICSKDVCNNQHTCRLLYPQSFYL